MSVNDITKTIYHEFELYRENHKDSGFAMIPSLVDVLVKSWIKDLERFELYHDSKNSEEHKKAAFFVYWMSKVKPIVIGSHHKHDRQITINEIFAFSMAMNMLKIGRGRISVEFFEEFVYSLYYRDTSPKQMFFAFETLDKLNQVIPDGKRII